MINRDLIKLKYYLKIVWFYIILFYQSVVSDLLKTMTFSYTDLQLLIKISGWLIQDCCSCKNLVIYLGYNGHWKLVLHQLLDFIEIPSILIIKLLVDDKCWTVNCLQKKFTRDSLTYLKVAALDNQKEETDVHLSISLLFTLR